MPTSFRSFCECWSVDAGEPTEDLAVPLVLSRLAQGSPTRPVWVNELGGVTFEVGTGDARRLRADAAVAVRALGKGLRALHEALPVAACPFSWSAEERVADAQTRRLPVSLTRGGWHPVHASLDLDTVFELVTDPPPVVELVVCHGDACAPNVLIALRRGHPPGFLEELEDLFGVGEPPPWSDPCRRARAIHVIITSRTQGTLAVLTPALAWARRLSPAPWRSRVSGVRCLGCAAIGRADLPRSRNWPGTAPSRVVVTCPRA
jgi:hypothetical protein